MINHNPRGAHCVENVATSYPADRQRPRLSHAACCCAAHISSAKMNRRRRHIYMTFTSQCFGASTDCHAVEPAAVSLRRASVGQPVGPAATSEVTDSRIDRRQWQRLRQRKRTRRQFASSRGARRGRIYRVRLSQEETPRARTRNASVIRGRAMTSQDIWHGFRISSTKRVVIRSNLRVESKLLSSYVGRRSVTFVGEKQ